MSPHPPLCVHCEFFNGVNGRDVCIRNGWRDLVRGWQASPSPALYERSGRFLWFGKDRCGPEGQHFTPIRPRKTPPPPCR